MIAGLAPEVRSIYAEGFTSALDSIFLVAAGIGVIGFILSWLLPEKPLRDTVAARAGDVGDEMGEVFPLPCDTDCDGKPDDEEAMVEARPTVSGAKGYGPSGVAK